MLDTVFLESDHEIIPIKCPLSSPPPTHTHTTEALAESAKKSYTNMPIQDSKARSLASE